MKLYRLLTGTDDSAFCHKVTAALNKGWELKGAASVAVRPDGGVVCAQVVIKKVNGVTYTPDIKLSDY